MSIRREFLSWDQPILPSAVSWLVENLTDTTTYGEMPWIDLSQLVIVVPGGLAGRRLTQLLVQKASEFGKTLVPPEVITVGQLPERLYETKSPFASELTQQIAWGEALRTLSREQISPLVPFPPETDDFESWREYGDMVRRVYRELASQKLDFAKVAEVTRSHGLPVEQKRWQLLQQVQDWYLSRLDELKLWDKQTARNFAVTNQLCSCDRPIVLLGTVDLNQTTRAMLDQVAQSRQSQVTALVGAPESWQDRFDSHGCIIAKKWLNVDLDLDWQSVAFVDGATAQADQVAGYVADVASRYSAKDIVIGLPVESALGEIRRVLESHHVPVRFGPGDSVATSVPFQLIESLVEYVDNGSYESLARLVRHPDLFQATALETVGIDELDRNYNQFLPLHAKNPRFSDRLQSLVDRIEGITQPLRSGKQSVRHWGERLLELLDQLYGEITYESDSIEDQNLARPLGHICEAIESWNEIPDQLLPSCTITEAMGFLRSQLGGTNVPEPVNTDAIECMGWLELSLNDAAVCIVTNFCDGIVPSAASPDVFLPDSVRRELQLEDDSLRYARDAYQAMVITKSRRDTFLIVPKRNASSEPMLPSRLLFTGKSEDLPKRVKKFFGRPQPSKNVARSEPSEIVNHGQLFGVPRPVEVEWQDRTWEKVSPTVINDYLKCKYRFYLRHVLKLKDINDEAVELDGSAFGNLAHDVLQRFGRSEVKDAADPDAIFEYLSQQLSERSRAKYGKNPRATIKIQVEQLRLRLEKFSIEQAKHRQLGWTIHACEAEPNPGPVLRQDDFRVELEGRIDRIDYHSQTNCWAIWDYKTSENVKSPRKSHIKRKNGEEHWISVQLPAYQMLAKALGIQGSVSLGLITLPKLGDEVKFRCDEDPLTSEDLENAQNVIIDAVKAMRSGDFFPPEELRYKDEFTRICQDDVLGKEVVS